MKLAFASSFSTHVRSAALMASWKADNSGAEAW
jgi:hypothetical protein